MSGTGNSMMNIVPRPVSLSTRISPLCCLMIPYVTERPSPVPFPAGLVVKKGSKSFFWISAGIPGPVSLTRISILPEDDRKVESRIRPGLPSMACSALIMRFIRPCWIRFAWTGAVAFDFPQEELDVPEDPRQRVLHLVGDPGPQLSESRHLFRLDELRLRPLQRLLAAGQSPGHAA